MNKVINIYPNYDGEKYTNEYIIESDCTAPNYSHFVGSDYFNTPDWVCPHKCYVYLCDRRQQFNLLDKQGLMALVKHSENLMDTDKYTTFYKKPHVGFQTSYNNQKKAKSCIINGMTICSIICWEVFAGILLIPIHMTTYLPISIIGCIIIIGCFLTSLEKV